jgi:hypothetical protein
VCRGELLVGLGGAQPFRLQGRRRRHGTEGLGIQPRVVEGSGRHRFQSRDQVGADGLAEGPR